MFHKTADQLHVIRELQSKATAILAGAAATTNIALTGATTADTLGSVIHNTAGTLADVTSEASITSDGNIQLSTTDTTGDQLVVEWYKHVGS